MKPPVGQRDSKALIIASAREEFARSGYAGARVARIASRAGVNKQLIFYYFGSKAGLYQSTVVNALREVVAPHPSGETARGRSQFRDALTALFAKLAAKPEVLDLLLRGGREAGGEAVLPSLVREISTIISASQGVGHFRDDADADLVALQAVLLLVAYLAMEPACSGLTPRDGRSAWLAACLDTLSRALAW